MAITKSTQNPTTTKASTFQNVLTPYLDALNHKTRQHWAPHYIKGVLAEAERKSVQRLANKIAPQDYDQLHHFIAVSPWPVTPLEEQLASDADHLVGGENAVLIVDDTTFLKAGRHSVGVGMQYSGVIGDVTNCQKLVSITLARNELPIPCALRLFLPEAWTNYPDRCLEAGVPKERLPHLTKNQIAIAEIDRLLAAGVRFKVVLADGDYGHGASFRQALTARDLLWAVAIVPTQKVYSEFVMVDREFKPALGRTPDHPVPSEESRAAHEVLADLPGSAWKQITWRRGTKGPLRAKFALIRVRVADGPKGYYGQHQPGEEVWLIGEKRSSGEVKVYLSNLPREASAREVVRAIKARWSCEQVHEQLKVELGLDHFEGRSWAGLHHHVVMVMIAFLFLQFVRLVQARRNRSWRVNWPPPSPSLPAVRRAVLGELFPLSWQCPHCGFSVLVGPNSKVPK